MPAPLGNKFAIGNSGKPKEFETPEELEKFINDYFEKVNEKKHRQLINITKNGDEIYKEKDYPYTLEGLCLHLHVTPQTLINYRKKKGYEEYFEVVKRAILKVRDQYITLGLVGDYENRLLQFVLTNIAPEDYKNKVEETKKGGFEVKHRIVVNTEAQAKKIDEFFEKE